jgi:hypothetical protein
MAGKLALALFNRFRTVGQRNLCSQSLHSGITLFLRYHLNTLVSELIKESNAIVSCVDLLVYNVGEEVFRLTEIKQRIWRVNTQASWTTKALWGNQPPLYRPGGSRYC